MKIVVSVVVGETHNNGEMVNQLVVIEQPLSKYVASVKFAARENYPSASVDGSRLTNHG